jgi:hypothetical protein
MLNHNPAQLRFGDWRDIKDSKVIGWHLHAWWRPEGHGYSLGDSANEYGNESLWDAVPVER